MEYSTMSLFRTRRVQQGDTVRIHYATRSLEGSLIETSENREALEFTVGSKEVIDGLSSGIVGMRAGESKTLSIPAEHAFGRRHRDLVQSVPLDKLDLHIAAGDQLISRLGHDDDVSVDLWVSRIKDGTATLDANHPLAGETLLVDVSLEEIAE